MNGVPDGVAGMIVRIGHADAPDRTAGVGVVVGAGKLISCAHVVNTALGRPPFEAQQPDGAEVYVEFPLLSGRPLRRAVIRAWRPPVASMLAGGDIAGLELVGEPPPSTARAARFEDPAVAQGGRVVLFGYPQVPPRAEAGGWSSYDLVGPVAGGRLQLDANATAALRAQPGYSGSPLVDVSSGRVVGLLAVAARGGSADCYAISATDIEEAWPSAVSIDRPNPYRSLNSFSEDDADLFFGREELTEALVEKVARYPLVAVFGASGVGKSSLVRAGLLARMHAEPGWRTARFRPGTDPYLALAGAMSALETGAPPTAEQLRHTDLMLRQRGLVAVGSVLAQADDSRLLVVVDQFEELYGPDVDPADRNAFLDQCFELAENPSSPLCVVLVMRTDLSQLVLDDPRALSLNDRTVYVPALALDGLRRIVGEPARRRGVNFPQDLEELIAAEASQGSGTLPLLEFVLTKMWSLREGRSITRAAYETLGRTAGALSRHADAADEAALEAGYSEAEIRQLLLALVGLGDDRRRPLRRVVRRDQLRGRLWRLAERYASPEVRLVVLDADGNGAQTAELTHEELLGQWRRLREVVEESIEFVSWRDVMDRRVLDGDDVPDSRLGEARDWLNRRPADVSTEIRELVERSERHAREREDEARRDQESRRAAASERLATTVLSSQRLPVMVGLVLGIEALDRAHTFTADTALRRMMSMVARQRISTGLAGSATALAFSGDGAFLAAGGSDGTVLVVEVDTAAERRLNAGTEPVLAVAFASDGSVFAASGGGTVRIIGANRDENLERFAPGSRLAEFSRDANLLAVVGEDGSAQLLKVADGAEVYRTDPGIEVSAVALAPAGDRFASSGSDGSLRVTSPQEGAVAAIVLQDDAATALSFTDDGDLIAAGGDRRVRRLSHRSGGDVESVLTTQDEQVRCMTTVPDGRVVVGRADGEVWILDRNGGVTARFDQGSAVTALSVAPGGRLVASAGVDGSVRVFDSTAGAEHAVVRHDSGLNAVAFSPDGRLLASGDDGGTVLVCAAGSGTEQWRVQRAGWINALAFSPDGRWLAVGSSDGTASIVSTADPSRARQIVHGGPVRTVTFSNDGARLATGADDMTALVVDVESGATVASVVHNGPVTSVAFSPGSERLVTGSTDSTARVSDSGTGKELNRFAHGGAVTSVTFASDGCRIATGCADGVARVFDVDESVELLHVDHNDRINRVAFSADGSRLASASSDGSALLVETALGDRRAWKEHTGWATWIDVSPTALHVASSGSDGVVWIIQDERETLAMLEPGCWTSQVVFSPDGAYVATAGRDHVARVWACSTESLRRSARSRVTREPTAEERDRWWPRVDAAP
jgi:WD40 repeat protein